VPGPRSPYVLDTAPSVGLSICYELSVPEHAVAAFDHGAEVYLASVAKTASGVEAASRRLSDIAGRFGAPVLMVNCVGTCDGVYCAGGSAIWNRRGNRIAHLDDTSEAILVFDTDREEATVAAAGG
jgi:predicted amidohydrolase